MCTEHYPRRAIGRLKSEGRPVRERPCWDGAQHGCGMLHARMPPSAACPLASCTAKRILEKQLGSQEREGEERRTLS